MTTSTERPNVNPVQTVILSELVRIAGGQRIPTLDGHIEFDDPTPGTKKGTATVTGRVVPQFTGDETVSFTVLLS